MFIQTLVKAPGQVTSAQVIKGQPTILATLPPPGWKWPKSSAPEFHPQPVADNTNAGGATSDEEDQEESRPSVEAAPTVVGELLNQRNGADEQPAYIFAKRKIYNTPFHKYWIVRHGEPLLSPPLEVDARHCVGPALFINIPTNREKQIWLWNTQDHKWDPIGSGHVVNLDVKRVLTLSDKNAPIFKAVREKQGQKDELRFIRCQPYA